METLSNNKYIIITGSLFLFLLVLIVGFFYRNGIGLGEVITQPEETETGDREIQIVVEGLTRPWEIREATDTTVFFTQRQDGLFRLDTTLVSVDDESFPLNRDRVVKIYEPMDLYRIGEGGMLGFELDNEFEENRQLYVCYNRQTPNTLDVVVEKVILDIDYNTVKDNEILIEGIPSATSGRHSGCRVVMDSDSNLWITTGDAADEDNPQDPDSLGGKILRVNRNGEGVDGNMEEPFDPRIFSYGHRNSQGIELIDGLKDPEFEKEVFGLTSEHGPDVDDEINLLAKGNFGWDPDPGYNENVPMTDTEKYPEAVKAVWNSGSETVATSGIEYVQGEEWGEWENSLLLATLKDSYIQRFEVEETGDVTPQEKIVTGYGRIRQIYQGSSGMLYFTTDNSNGNDIIAIIESK